MFDRLFPHGPWQMITELMVFFSTVVLGIILGVTLTDPEVVNMLPAVILCLFWGAVWFFGIFLPAAKLALRNYDEDAEYYQRDED